MNVKSDRLLGFNFIGQSNGIFADFFPGNPNDNGDYVQTVNLLVLLPFGDYGGLTNTNPPTALATSLVSDRGDCNNATDQRGYQLSSTMIRVHDNQSITNGENSNGCDIGANEHFPSLLYVQISDFDNDGAVDDLDCAPGDASRFQELVGYIDGDGDGFGTGAIMMVCSGAQLPAGYVATNTDCNDANPNQYQTYSAYNDLDRDTYGAGRLVTNICAGSQLPSNYSTNSTDCNDNNSSLYRFLSGYVDTDEDGFGAGNLIPKVCAGTSLPLGYSIDGTDCNDRNQQVYQLLSGYIDIDQDTFGVGDLLDVCSGPSLPNTHSLMVGDNCPTIANPDQLDTDMDGVGDACQNLPPDTEEELCVPIKTVNGKVALICL